MKMFLKLLSSM